MAAIATASKLIPFIVGFHMPVHPQLQYWAEFSTGGALFAQNNRNPAIKRAGVTYQSTEPGDAGLFYPIDAYARDRAAHKEDGRYTPRQVMRELLAIAANADKHLRRAEAAGLPDTNEARGAALDVRMLAALARYHRHKIAAALALCQYQQTDNLGHLAGSLASMRAAKAQWVEFAELGQKYHSRLTFYVGVEGPCRDGNWKDFYEELDADIAALEELAPENAANAGSISVTDDYGDGNIHLSSPGLQMAASWRDDAPAACVAGEPLAVTLRTGETDVFRDGVTLRYRHTNQLEGHFLRQPMELRDGAWRAEIPAGYITPEWDLLLYFEAASPEGDGMLHPGVWNSAHPLPYRIVEVKRSDGATGGPIGRVNANPSAPY